CCKLYKRSDNDGEKNKIQFTKKVATLALANLLLVGALTDNSAKAESKKDDTDLKLVSHNVYMLSTVLYPNWRLLT
ncbi:TPA: sphingomyelin phosphodiesterase, partial [Staphylococcus aureus]